MGEVLVWTDTGPRACGISVQRPTTQVIGVHASSPTSLLGMDPPPRIIRAEGWADNGPVTLVSWEVACFLEHLRDGDFQVLEIPFGPRPLRASSAHGQLLEQVRFSICSAHLQSWWKALDRMPSSTEHGAWDRARSALTATLLARTGELVLDFSQLLGALEIAPGVGQDPAALYRHALDLFEKAMVASPVPDQPDYADLQGFLDWVRDAHGDA